MATKSELQLVISAKDNASGKLANLSGSVKKTTNNFQDLNKYAKWAGVAIAGLAVKIGIDAVKASMSFEKSMGDVATLIDTNVENMDEMGKKVKDISTRMPVALEDLTSALYDVRSAGIAADKAMGVLEQSAVLATAGLSTTKEATNILTSAMNSFKTEGLEASEVADILFKTVKAGKTTVSELSRSFGASAPVIAEAGIKLADFSAATASLTTTGLPASQAQMGLRQAIVALIKPTTDMEAIFKKLGVETGQEVINSSANMGEAFAKLKTVADEQNISWAKSVGSVEALNAVTGILGTTNEAYIGTLETMTEGENALNEAFEKQNETAASQYQLLENNLKVVLIELGNKIMPTLIKAAQWLNEVLDPEVLKIWIDGWKEVGETINWVLSPIQSLIKHFGLVEKAINKTRSEWESLTSLLSKGISAVINIKEKFSKSKKKALGGAVNAGESYIVGEHRPEVFVPSQSGNIKQVGQGGGSKEITVNFNNVNVRGDGDLQSIIEAVKKTLNSEQELYRIGAI